MRKVLWTCEEIKLPFEQEDWGVGFQSTQQASFLALNPNAMVPVIQDGDFVLWESNSIIRYLATQHGGLDIYPAQPRDRAKVDQWIDWQAADLNRSWSYAFMALVRQSSAHQDMGAVAASCAAWSAFMQVLERQWQHTGAYVVGSDFTLADIPIGLSVNRWFKTPFDHPIFPAVAAYYARLDERSGYRKYGNNGTA